MTPSCSPPPKTSIILCPAARKRGDLQRGRFRWPDSTASSARSGARRRSDQPARARARESVREDRGVQPDGLGEGPPRARRDRGRRAHREAAAGPDRGRGDQRQHRHRPRDGVRAEGLSAGRDDGGELQRRAAQDDALPRREGGAHARGAEGQRHAREGGRARRDARLVPVPAVRERGQRGHAQPHHRAGDPRGLRGRPARLLRHRLRHGRDAQGRGARAAREEARDAGRGLRARQRADPRRAASRSRAPRTAPRPAAIRASART